MGINCPFTSPIIINLRKITSEMNLPNFNIEIDGGVKIDNIKQCISAGANILVAGSAIYNNEMTPSNAVKELRLAIKNSLEKWNLICKEHLVLEYFSFLFLDNAYQL